MEENKKTPQFFTGGDLLYIVLIIIISTILFRQCDAAKRAKTREKLANANIEALKDSVRYEKNKRGEEIAIKKALLADKKNLESLNAELAREVKELKVRPVTIQVVGGTIAADPSCRRRRRELWHRKRDNCKSPASQNATTCKSSSLGPRSELIQGD
jgi:hypothetical protein